MYKVLDSKWSAYLGAEVKEIICDTKADLADLPDCTPGSTALVATEGTMYIVNASGEWVEFGSGE